MDDDGAMDRQRGIEKRPLRNPRADREGGDYPARGMKAGIPMAPVGAYFS